MADHHGLGTVRISGKADQSEHVMDILCAFCVQYGYEGLNTLERVTHRKNYSFQLCSFARIMQQGLKMSSGEKAKETEGNHKVMFDTVIHTPKEAICWFLK